MSFSRSFKVDRVSLTVPGLLPPGTPTKLIQWQHFKTLATLTIKADADFVTFETKGGVELVRTIASKVNKRSGNSPILTHDHVKFMFRYDWPPSQHPDQPTQERIQFRLAEKHDMGIVVNLLEPHFNLSVIPTSQTQSTGITDRETPSQQKRRRLEAETQPLTQPRQDESQASPPGTPILEYQKLPRHDTDPPSDRTIKATPRNPPPWCSPEPLNPDPVAATNPPGSIPEEEEEQAVNYSPLQPHVTEETDLIDFNDPINHRAHSDFDDFSIQIDNSRRDSADEVDEDIVLVDKLPPLLPSQPSRPTVFPVPHPPPGSFDQVIAPSRCAYDLTEQEMEERVIGIIHERGFPQMVGTYCRMSSKQVEMISRILDRSQVDPNSRLQYYNTHTQCPPQPQDQPRYRPQSQAYYAGLPLQASYHSHNTSEHNQLLESYGTHSGSWPSQHGSVVFPPTDEYDEGFDLQMESM